MDEVVWSGWALEGFMSTLGHVGLHVLCEGIGTVCVCGGFFSWMTCRVSG